jgi:phosphoribosylcarboxyaminoimidazole (NCAIR) mutase
MYSMARTKPAWLLEKTENIMTNLRKTSVTAIAAAALLAASTFATTTPAQAGNYNGFVAGLIGGAVVTGIIAANTAPVYATPVYQAHCWYQPQVIGYDNYGRQVVQNVRYCQ